MSTPLEVRNRRRECQRAIRLAINALNNSIDAWKAAIDDGKKHATNLTNELLTCSHLSSLPLACLADIPDLKHRCIAKTHSNIVHLLHQLQSSLSSLHTSLDTLIHAVASVSALLSSPEEEEGKETTTTHPVFTTLPLGTIVQLFQRIQRQYRAEVRIKECVVSDCTALVAKALNNNLATEDSGDGDRLFLQTHITAWMVSVEIDDGDVDADVATLTQEAQSV